MNTEVYVGEIAIGKENETLSALGIGSCLVVTLYDSKNKVGAVAHTMLSNHSNPNAKRDIRYIDNAIDEMLDKLREHGARTENLEAKLIGGANMFSAFESNIGKDNVSSAKKKLKEKNIPVVGECVGGSQGRSVEFSVATGIVTVKTKF